MRLTASINPAARLTAGISTGQRLSAGINRAATIYQDDYEKLKNRPQINDVELIGNKSFEDLGFEDLTALDVFNIMNEIWEE